MFDQIIQKRVEKRLMSLAQRTVRAVQTEFRKDNLTWQQISELFKYVATDPCHHTTYLAIKQGAPEPTSLLKSLMTEEQRRVTSAIERLIEQENDSDKR